MRWPIRRESGWVSDYCFGLTRPGIGLFGGGLGPDGTRLAPVAGLEARIIQLRDVPAGQTRRLWRDLCGAAAVADCGGGAGLCRWLCAQLFQHRGAAIVDGVRCPVAGRVAMDLTAFDVTDARPLAEGDWLSIDFDLAAAAAASGRTEYELLTGLGARYARVCR